MRSAWCLSRSMPKRQRQPLAVCRWCGGRFDPSADSGSKAAWCRCSGQPQEIRYKVQTDTGFRWTTNGPGDGE